MDLRQFLGDLVAQLTMEQQAKGVSIRTELDADDLLIDPDKLPPLALFAVEAISNAQKHALAHRGGALRVTFFVQNDEAELSIGDDGPGGEPEPPKEGGVGRVLMSAFARQLHGRMETTINDGGGVTVRLSFPTPALGVTKRPAAPKPQAKSDSAAA